MKKRNWMAFDVVNTLLMLGVALAVGLPLLYVLVMSLDANSAVRYVGLENLFSKYNFGAYRAILQSPQIPRAYGNSLLYTVVGTVISLVLVTMTAYPLSKKKLRGRRIFLLLISFTMFFNGGLIPIFLLIQNLHLMDTMWAIVLPWAVPAYELMLMRTYFEGIPEEVYEASRIDGASEYRTLAQIVIPMSLPILATLTLFFARAQWNNYLVPLMYLSSARKFPLQVVLQEMLMQDSAKAANDTLELVSLSSNSLKNATIIISVIPILVLYPFVQKYFVNGLYAGAVKG